MDCHNLCVYGTLRRGNYNCWAEVEAMQLINPADTLSGYYMRTHGGYPAIFEGKPEDKVHVEVLEMTTNPRWQEVFDAINRMEFGAGYFRRLVTTDSGIEAWVYVMPHEREDWFDIPIESGDWNLYREEAA